MSLENAFHFLSNLRKDQTLQAQLLKVQDELCVVSLVSIGKKLGYLFDAAELNQAYKHEWTMRWIHYRSRQNNR